jgi:hypothetical protein
MQAFHYWRTGNVLLASIEAHSVTHDHRSYFGNSILQYWRTGDEAAQLCTRSQILMNPYP